MFKIGSLFEKSSAKTFLKVKFLHTYIARPKKSGAMYITQRALQEVFSQVFFKVGWADKQSTHIHSFSKAIGHKCTSCKDRFKKVFAELFSKSAEPTSNQRTHIAFPKPSGAVYILQRPIQESFCGAFFKKRQRKTAFSFCKAFSFALLVSKEKAIVRSFMFLCFYVFMFLW